MKKKKSKSKIQTSRCTQRAHRFTKWRYEESSRLLFPLYVCTRNYVNRMTVRGREKSVSQRRDARLTWRELLIIRRAKPRQRRRPPFFPPPSPFRRELLLLEGCLRRLFADWRLERFEKRVRGQSLSERIDPLSPPSLSLSLFRACSLLT